MSTTKRSSRVVKKGRGGAVVRFFLFFLLLAAAGFAFAAYWLGEPPERVLRRGIEWVQAFFDTESMPAAPAVVALPPPVTPTNPISGPEPVPTSTPTPAPEPTPPAEPAPDPLVWLVQNQAYWPREVTLAGTTEFPVVVSNVLSGRAEVPGGRQVNVVEINSDGLTVKFQAGTRQLSFDDTDLRERAVTAMATFQEDQEKALAEPAEVVAPEPELPEAQRAPMVVSKPRQGGTFEHPGCLSTKEDLERMKKNVKAGKQPWKGSWDILVQNTDRSVNDAPGTVERVRAGEEAENFMTLARDCAKVYQLALRYHGTGEDKFADKAVEIMNAWAGKHTGWDGNSNVRLRAGIYGHQLACGAELMRDYKGWDRSDFNKFKDYMQAQFLPHNTDFLRHRHGTPISHYWANWTLANQASMLAIGVLCDDRKVFDEGLAYFDHGDGTEAIYNAVNFIHPNGLGQWQESGRDQGHTLMGPQLMGTVCEIAWNQGIDLYSRDRNRFLAGIEYISKYNLGQDVPFVTYVRVFKGPWGPQDDVMEVVSPHGRGALRPGWDLVYNHYVNRLGLAAPWTEQFAEKARPEGGGFNNGGNSGGFDGLGFTTLTHSREPIVRGAPPSNPSPYVEGRKITLSWSGTANATSYIVRRATEKVGPYIPIAKVDGSDLFYADDRLEADTTYFYSVSATTPKGETARSEPVPATTTAQLFGEIIGTEGSLNDSGATGACAFDGSLENYFEGPEELSWVGLELDSKVGAVITEIKFCPRLNHAKKMKGGIFQGSNSADFATDVVDLYRIAQVPPEGEFTSQRIINLRTFRYVRYLGPEEGNACVAEIQFLGKLR